MPTADYTRCVVSARTMQHGEVQCRRAAHDDGNHRWWVTRTGARHEWFAGGTVSATQGNGTAKIKLAPPKIKLAPERRAQIGEPSLPPEPSPRQAAHGTGARFVVKSGCNSCPLADYVMDRCQHPTGRLRGVAASMRDNTAPEFCPLRSEPILISLGGT